MASKRHRRRTGADRFWPGPQTRAGTGVGPGGRSSADATGLADVPEPPVQPAWSERWRDDPDLDPRNLDQPDPDLADPDQLLNPGVGDDDGAPSIRAPKVPRDPEAAARQICLRLITIEPRTRAQLAQAMQRKQIPDAVAEGIIDRFTEVGLIDDQAFARAWVESRHHSRGLSRGALSTELRRRGVDADDVREAVETLDPDQEAATARQIVDRKLRSTRGQPYEARMRRLVGALARKGYGAALSFRIVREALEAEGAHDAEAAELAGVLDDQSLDIGLDDGPG
ncbi:MAG TPA: regulatory protein RecX [Streptosporangiaceae bacterium]